MGRNAEIVPEMKIKFIDQKMETGKAVLKLIELSNRGQVYLDLDQISDDRVRIRASWIERVKEVRGDI